MDKKLYSKAEFDELRDRLNKEIKRRGTFKWWDPLTTPSVGVDRSSKVDDKTFTINNPSTGSIVPTQNIEYPSHGNNPVGDINTSSARFDVDELQNFLIGLSKIHDIDLFYSRDEKAGTMFRDPSDIETKLEMAEADTNSSPMAAPSDKYDPNNGITDKQYTGIPPASGTHVAVPIIYPSGEFDGEELLTGKTTPDKTNFYDDYGAAPGVVTHRPQNPYVSEIVTKTIIDQDDQRNEIITKQVNGGKDSIRFGLNPRNPSKGSEYQGRQVFGGSIGSCHVACFKAGTLIETIDGPTPIEEITIGTKVLTQNREYHKVYQNFKRECNDGLIALRATGTPIIYTTEEHPFWVKKYIGLGRDVDKKFKQLYVEPGWVEAKDIKSRDKLCLLTPKFGTIKIDPGIAYMVGRWLGDGWVTNSTNKEGRVYQNYEICCSFIESPDLEQKMDKIGIKYSKGTPYTVSRYHLFSKVENGSPNSKLINIVRNCGKYSHGKYLDSNIFNWDKASIESLLEGYFDSDGSRDRNRIRTSSVSKKLTYGIATLMRMIGKNPSWSERSYVKSTGIIQGRIVNMRTSYGLSMFIGEISKHYSEYDFENELTWASVTLKMIPDHKYDVYNLSVEGDPTYYADGVLVHNCTGLCYLTCDNQCSESCSTTCWSRCGNACHADCGNVCTGCTTQCYSTCKTKCSNTGGKSCVNAGADTVFIDTTGNPSGCSNNCGQTASSAVIQNTTKSSVYKCSGCSYSCQFYPNKKTTCWDSVCSTLCFITCNTYCSTSCFGGCISNSSEHNGGYKSGKGQSCKEGCVADCTGDCAGVCEGSCTSTCFDSCTHICGDSCVNSCSTACGKCDTGCNVACTGCDGCTGSCNTSCTGTCYGCTSACTATCKTDCNANTGVKII